MVAGQDNTTAAIWQCTWKVLNVQATENCNKPFGPR